MIEITTVISTGINTITATEIFSRVIVCSGKNYPLGATLERDGTNFALFSANAEKVELCLFNTSGSREIARIPLPCRSNDVWHGFVHGVTEGTRYGYQEITHTIFPNALLQVITSIGNLTNSRIMLWQIRSFMKHI